MQESRPLILGAGPAGLACADALCRAGVRPGVVEKNSSAGGLCRTLEFEGFLFDIGGHRFLSSDPEVNRLWREVLGADLLRVNRKSRIYYRERFFDYPLEPLSALRTLGLAESARCVASYLFSRWSGKPDERRFEGWMTRRFGKRLYEIFFKSYTEKVWGIPCGELSSDWAVERIQSLSLRKALLRKLIGKSSPKTLSEEFFYPRRGPGLFCDRWKALLESRGAHFSMDCRAEEIFTAGNRVTEVLVSEAGGESVRRPAAHLFSSIPLPLLVQKMNPAPPDDVLDAARNLKFRSFMAVNLVFDQKEIFPDNWIYVHSPGIRAARIQNYKNWSDSMVPDPSMTTLGVEYFVDEGDDLWKLSDAAMMELALRELEEMRLVVPGRFVKGFVFRVSHAYPVYGPDYRKNLAAVLSFLDRFENLSLMGREGLFRYDNSDQAMLTGLEAAGNYLKNSVLSAVAETFPEAEVLRS